MVLPTRWRRYVKIKGAPPEDREGRQDAGQGVLGGEELRGDHGREVAVDDEVVPSHEVAYRRRDDSLPARRRVDRDPDCRHAHPQSARRTSARADIRTP